MARSWAEFQSAQALRSRMDRIAYDASLQDPVAAQNYRDYWTLDRLTGTSEIQEYLREGLTDIRGNKGKAFVTIHPETDPLHARMTALSLLVMARHYGEVDLRTVTIDDTPPERFPIARAVATQGENPSQLGVWFSSTVLRADNRETFLRDLLREERNAFGAQRRFGVGSTAVHEFGHGISWVADALRRNGKLQRSVQETVLNSVRPDELKAIWGAVVHRYGNELRNIEASGADPGKISNLKADLHQNYFGSDTVLRNQQAAAAVAAKIGTYANSTIDELDADTVAGAVLGGDSRKGLTQDLFAELMWDLDRSADDRPRFLDAFLHGMQVTELDRAWKSGYVPENNTYLLAAASEPLLPLPPPTHGSARAFPPNRRHRSPSHNANRHRRSRPTLRRRYRYPCRSPWPGRRRRPRPLEEARTPQSRIFAYPTRELCGPTEPWPLWPARSPRSVRPGEPARLRSPRPPSVRASNERLVNARTATRERRDRNRADPPWAESEAGRGTNRRQRQGPAQSRRRANRPR